MMYSGRGPTRYDPHRKTWRTASWSDRRVWLIDAGYNLDCGGNGDARWIGRNWSKLPPAVRTAVARVLSQREHQPHR